MLIKDTEGNWTVKGQEDLVAHCYDRGDSVEVIYKNGKSKILVKTPVSTKKEEPVKKSFTSKKEPEDEEGKENLDK